MKKTILLFSVILIITSCSSNFDDVYNEVIFNNTMFDVRVTQDPKFVFSSSDKYTYTIKAGEKINVNTKNKTFVTAVITPVTYSDKVFGIDLVDGGYEIKSYNYWVNYKITGTAKHADLTYSNPSGGTNQISVDLPYNVTFKEKFQVNFLYISAQNDDTGSLRVEIFLKDNLENYDECNGFACIASTQTSI